MNWKLIISIFITMILMPATVVGTTAWLSSKAKQILVNKWGSEGQLYAGGLGTVLHESGHVLVAWLFHHRVTSFKLLRIKGLNNPNIHTLGYVNHVYDRDSFYQELGNFFIGIAPFFTSAGFLYLAHRFLIGTQYDFSFQPINTATPTVIETLLTGSLNNIKISLLDDAQHPLMSLIFAILVLEVSFCGYSISKEDWKGSLEGIGQYIAFVLICSIILFTSTAFGTGYIATYAWSFAMIMLFLMINSWLYVGFSMLVVVGAKKLADHYNGYSSYPRWSFNNLLGMFSKPKGRHFK